MFNVSEAGGSGGRSPPSASHAKCNISQKHTSVLIVSAVVVSVQVVSVVVVPVISVVVVSAVVSAVVGSWWSSPRHPE